MPPPRLVAEPAVMVVCAVCGQKSRQVRAANLAPEGPPDLDLRPAAAARAAMPAWLQQCPTCFYAAPRLDRAGAAERTVVKGANYRALLAEDGYPPLARRFLARAMLHEEQGDLHGAAEHTLHAAWVADDFDQAELAALWRQESVALFRAGPELSLEQRLRIVDILRRAEDFPGALEEAESMAGAPMSEPMARVLAFERRLIRAGDAASHTVAAALPPPAARPHAAMRGTAPTPSLFARLLGWLRRR
jgi:hypothetical protein